MNYCEGTVKYYAKFMRSGSNKALKNGLKKSQKLFSVLVAVSFSTNPRKKRALLFEKGKNLTRFSSNILTLLDKKKFFCGYLPQLKCFNFSSSARLCLRPTLTDSDILVLNK